MRERESDLYRVLGDQGKDLYRYVSERYPTWENSRGPFGLDAPGSKRDHAFRILLRSVVEDTFEPKRWRREVWSDSLVVEACRDPELIRRAWALLTETGDASWAAMQKRRNRSDRLSVFVIVGVLLAAGVVGFLVDSFWPYAVVILGIVLVGAFLLGRSRQNGRDWKGER